MKCQLNCGTELNNKNKVNIKLDERRMSICEDCWNEIYELNDCPSDG